MTFYAFFAQLHCTSSQFPQSWGSVKVAAIALRSLEPRTEPQAD